MHKESSVLLAEYLGHAERPVLLLGWQQQKLNRQGTNKHAGRTFFFPATTLKSAQIQNTKKDSFFSPSCFNSLGAT